jgi:hypothetical protein
MGRPAGSRLAAPSEVLAGSALVGQAVLYRWPVEGWVRGTVTGRSRTAGSVLARGAVRPHPAPPSGRGCCPRFRVSTRPRTALRAAGFSSSVRCPSLASL